MSPDTGLTASVHLISTDILLRQFVSVSVHLTLCKANSDLSNCQIADEQTESTRQR